MGARRKSTLPVIVGGEEIGKIVTSKTAAGVVRHDAYRLDGTVLGTFDTWPGAQIALTGETGVGPAGHGRVRTLTGLWELRDHPGGDVIGVGNTVYTARDEKILIEKIVPPHKTGSQGKVLYRTVDKMSHENDVTHGAYVSVIGARWVCLEGEALNW